MQAIETEYKGYKFRSRLEARWAVFFDTIGMEWRYETEGFEVDGHRYLPDFWLPTSKTWVEVKGDPQGLRKDFARMRVILGQASPLPGFAAGDSELLVLGDVPQNAPRTVLLHPCLHRRDGILSRTWGFFMQGKRGVQFASDSKQSYLLLLFDKYCWDDPSESAESRAWNVETWALDTPGTFPLCAEAYRAARQARFEHGAHGT